MPGYKNNEVHYPTQMKELVPFASGSGYALSSDLIHYLVVNLPMFTPFFNEDVSIGTWLFPLNVNRVHEPRLNVGYRCDNDAIIIHAVKSVTVMETMYNNTMDKGSCLCDNIFVGDVM